MKRFLIPFLALPFLVSCNSQYPSAAEASAACEKWRSEGGTVEVELDRSSPMIDPPEFLRTEWHTLHVRACRPDPAGLYLGTVKGNLKPGQRFTRDQHDLFDAETPRIVKRFRY